MGDAPVTLERLALQAGWLLPVLLAVAVLLHLRRRRRVAAALGDAAVVARLVGTDLVRISRGLVALVMGAGLALGAALMLAAVSAGESEPAATGGAGTVVLVLDASNSMRAADLRPDRITVQAEAAREIVRSAAGSAIGIVIFAGRAFTLTPPTADHNALMVYLDALDPEMVTQSGSSLHAAVRQGLGLLLASAEDVEGGALVLISDGDDPGGDGEIDATIELARRAGIVIHTLGAGTPRGAPVPIAGDPNGGPSYMTTPDGAEVVSRLDDRVLRSIAAGTGGIHATLAEGEGAGAVAAAVASGSSAAADDGPDARYALPAGLAALLLLVQSLAATRTRRTG